MITNQIYLISINRKIKYITDTVNAVKKIEFDIYINIFKIFYINRRNYINTSISFKIGSFLKGNDDKGWMLTAEGLKFCKNSKYKFNHSIVRKKRLSKIDKKYLIREENRIKNTDAFNKYFYGNKANITAEEIKKLFKVDDYTSKPDLQRRIVNILDNFKDEDNIYKLIDSYKKEVLQYVN